MQKKYFLERIDHGEYKRYLIYLSHENFVEVLPEIQAFVAQSFRNDEFKDAVKVMIDLTGVVKDDKGRFLDCTFRKGKLYFESFVEPDEFFIKKTEEMLKEHPEYRDA